ncbi:MAG: DUF4199 domain-containing protein [Chitinophagaceae bacterium]
MKKVILTFGGIAGLIVSIFIVVLTVANNQTSKHIGNEFVGYSIMIIAFSFIFVGVKNFRDRHNNGVISFWQATKIGLGITLIASTIYVAIWLVDFYLFVPDFMDKYASHMIDDAKKAGLSGAALQKKIDGMNEIKELYKKPIFVILFTYLEIAPVGILISLIAAFILKRKTAPSTALA